jgi:hypothetical protein
MKDGEVLVGGVPKPFALEAASGWLSRLALSQGCSIRELKRFLNLHLDRDLDLQLHGPVLSELRRKCGLAENSFAFAETVVQGLHYAQLGAGWLIGDNRYSARFRYCPACLGRGGEGGGVMLIQWRFLAWRFCPIHRCLTEQRCFACGANVRFPVDMAKSRAGREGFASQRRCQRCAVDLAEAPQVRIDFEGSEQLSDREFRWLSAGHQYVAILCGEGSVEHVHFRPSSERLEAVSLHLPSHATGQLIEARIRRMARRGIDALPSNAAQSRVA